MLTLNDNGKQIKLDNPIKSGGEGSVYMHPLDSKSVIKIYHQPKDLSYKNKLESLNSLPNQFVKPQKVFTDRNQVIGFTMNYVNFNDFHLFSKLFNKAFCTQNQFDNAFKIKVLENIKHSILEVHKRGFVVSDCNQYNIFFDNNANVVFVDVDSYQEKSNILSDVVLDDIRDFTTNTISESTDIWAFDILTFWCLSYVHPFKWLVKGQTQNLEERVKKGLSYLSNIPNIVYPALYEKLPTQLEEQFKEIFKGRRFFIDFINSVQHIPVVVKQAIVSAIVNIRNIVSGTSFYYCQNSFSIKIGKKWRLYTSSTSFIEIEADVVYPSMSNYAYVKNNVLFDSKQQKVKDLNGFYSYYHNGSLFCLGDDEYFIFKIENQLALIDNSRGVIYSKSVFVRDAIIQHFGKKSVVNDVVNKSLIQFDVPSSIKNAFVCDNYIAIEYEENNKIVYALFKKNNLKLDKLFYLSNLVSFTSVGDILFIPSNGEILVYKDTTLIEKIDVSICTEQSVLHRNAYGILLFENSNLYILNKKQ